MQNTWRQLKEGITFDYSVQHPWRPVDDVTSIHWARLRGQRWPTTGHSRTQRGTSLLPFPRGSGVTAAYKERIPTATLHPQSPSTPALAPRHSARRFPGTSVAFPWQQPLTELGVTVSRDAASGTSDEEGERKMRVTRRQGDSKMQVQQLMKRSGDLESESCQNKCLPEYKAKEKV